MKRLALCLLSLGVLACGLIAPDSSPAASERPAAGGGIWMASDPGCGGSHWAQHPAGFALTCDPVAMMEKVRWSSWGGATARATGTLNVALLNSHDSVATAPRHRYAAVIVASQLERCDGRRAYGSVAIHYKDPRTGTRKTLTGPEPLCKKTAPAPGTSSGAAEFRARPEGGFVACGMYAEAGEKPEVRCQANPRVSEGEDPLVQLATLQPNGRVAACSQPLIEAANHCDLGNAGDPIPTYSPGKRVRVGPFACKVLTSGVECTVVASGKGFLITPGAVLPVAG